MASERVMGRAIRLVLALAVFGLHACGGGIGSSGGTGSTALWISPALGPNSSAGGSAGPLWINANNATLPGTMGPQPGDTLYGVVENLAPGPTPPRNPWYDHPICVPAAMDNLQEQTVEGRALLYYQSLVFGGGGGLGGGFGLVIRPPFNANDKLRIETRAACKHIFLHGAPSPTAGFPEDMALPAWASYPNGLEARLWTCGVNFLAGSPAAWYAIGAVDATAAWNAMSGGAQGWISNMTSTGWVGGGYWQNQAGSKNYGLTCIETATGQVP